jgi:hypothetical protein
VSQSKDHPAENRSTQYWLWVTRPEYYLDEDRNDRKDLDPSFSADTGGFWTCHRNTRKGDLVLLWRTLPRSDIGYLIQACSDAYSIADDPGAESSWDYGCDYRFLFKFSKPLTVAEIRADPYLLDWTALRGHFQGKVFLITSPVWEHLLGRLQATNPGFSELLQRLANSANAPINHVLEEHLERYLVTHLGLLSKHGFDLELIGRQIICTGLGGRIDLLCHDRRLKRNVVVELKRGRAGQNTFGQVSTYMGWTNDHHQPLNRTVGLVIADGFDNYFISAAKTNPKIRYFTLEELDLVRLAAHAHAEQVAAGAAK